MEKKAGGKECTGENAEKSKPLSSKRESEGGRHNRGKAEKSTGVCSCQPGEWSRHKFE